MKNNLAASGQDSGAIGLCTAIKIMERWGATHQQISMTLGVSRQVLKRAKGVRFESIALESEQLGRIACILNMHAALRTIFENPANVYGFVSMPNGNEFFDGRTPLDVIADGSLASLYETSRRLDGLLHGGW
jgi:hypothetical protein